MNNKSQSEKNEMSNEETVQYLTFTLDGEAYATEITKVREVLEHTEVRKVPKTPDYMQGVINLRGSVIPVVDMRMQFGLGVGEITIETCIIIIEVNIDGNLTVLGALADSVQEVIDLSEDQMEPAPTLGARVNNKFIHAMGKTSDDKFIIVLNMDKVFSAEQINEVEAVGSNGGATSDTEAA